MDAFNIIKEFIKENKIFPFVIITLLSNNLIDMANLFSKYVLEKTLEKTGEEQSETKLAMIKFVIMCVLMWFFIVISNWYL